MPTSQPVNLEAMTDAALAADVEREMAARRPRQAAFALAMAAGKTATDAAGEAGLSTVPTPLKRQQKRAQSLLRLTREQARRRSLVAAAISSSRSRCARSTDSRS